ncbi:ASCH domain-containing protein (plasmid) [Shewanella sp. LC6]|uniref:ASCH domain-containing protein n=1 Tax=unclassified Shewanella TaxID=196818 RepID=UPI001127127F|nr:MULTISPECIES: ASCH domain-containing protein [unclassified Shewanella]QQK62710.1 ASCH domain-containing protein [Shewanella sp. LC6]TPE64200.1 ASCH domain-containing protein [Shewanella sp. LC2]
MLQLYSRKVIVKKRILHLSVKKIYFDQIRSGEKPDEYRLVTEYWIRRLEGREYDEIHVKCGYPKAGDMFRIEVRPWSGFAKEVITHPHFGTEPVEVFAIHVN